MKHPSEEELILYHYGEAPSVGGDIARHLDGCEICKASYQELLKTFQLMDQSPIPERGPRYGEEVWRRLSPKLQKQHRPAGTSWFVSRLIESLTGFQPPRWAVAGGLAALVFAAFLAGRFWPGPAIPRESVAARPVQSALPGSPQARERILRLEIGNHLERSQLALIELINSKTNGFVDISWEQTMARKLVDVNRLYRQSAVRSEDVGLASILEDLERTLIEIANSPSRLSGAEYAELRRRVNTDDMLFKVKILGAQLRAKEHENTIKRS